MAKKKKKSASRSRHKVSVTFISSNEDLLLLYKNTQVVLLNNMEGNIYGSGSWQGM